MHLTAKDLPRLVIGGLFFLLGPGALVGYGLYRWTSPDTMTATATATVVRLHHYEGSNHTQSECPVYSWDIDGRGVQAESNYCDAPAAVGAKVQIRYDPKDPNEVVPDVPEARHQEAVPLFAATGLCTLLAAFFLWPKRRKGVT